MHDGSGRKTWGTAGSIHLKETEGRNEALGQQGVDPSYREYLAVLQEKNRILKELRKKEEDRQAAISERERGFDLNFKGANEDRIRRKQEREQAAGGRAPRAGSAGARHRAGDAAPPRGRSTWQKGSVHIETTRGSVIRLAPPRSEQTRESMQWLVSEEGRSWLDSDDGQQWLEGEEGGVQVDQDGQDAGADRDTRVNEALALVAATLKYNGLTAEEGFAEFDSDSDGRVTLNDIDGIVKSLAMELSEADTRDMFAFLDKDDDGFVDVVDWVRSLLRDTRTTYTHTCTHAYTRACAQILTFSVLRGNSCDPKLLSLLRESACNGSTHGALGQCSSRCRGHLALLLLTAKTATRQDR